MAIEQYKKISEMGVSGSLTDNSLIPFVKPGDSNNYIVTYKTLSDSILDEIDFDPEIYQTVNQTNSIFNIDYKTTPYASIYLDGLDTVNTITVTNLDDGDKGKILVRQKGNKKIALTNMVGYIDLPETVDSMILITYFKTGGIIYASSVKVNETGQQLSPDTISDLLVVYYDATSVRLQWSAPNSIDFGTPVTSYDIRYTNNNVDPNILSNWNSMKRVSQSITPKIPGTVEYFSITSLEPNKEYYIYIKSIGNYNGINYYSSPSNLAFCKTLGSENTSKAYRISFSNEQVFTVSDEVNVTDNSTINAEAIHLQQEMIDEETSNVFLDDGYPDITKKDFLTYHMPYKYSRLIRPYFIYIDLYKQYSMDRIYIYSQEKFGSTIYGIKDKGYPIEEIGVLGDNVAFKPYDHLDMNGKTYRYIIISQDQFDCVAGVTDNLKYSSATPINNLLLYGRPVDNIPARIHEPLRRATEMRPVDQWFNVNGHVYQNPDIHAISGGNHPRLYANYDRWTAWDGLHNYDSVADFKYTLNTNPWIKNNNYQKVSPDNLMLQYKALGLKPFFCTLGTIKQVEYEGMRLKNLDDYWYPGKWRPQSEDGIGGMNRFFEVSRDPESYKAISKLQYHLAARFGNNTTIDPNTLDLEPTFSGNTESNNIGLGVLSGLEVENEIDGGIRLQYHDPLEYAAMSNATLDGNGDSLEDENGVKLFGIKKADPTLYRIMPGVAQGRESYVYLGFLQLLANTPTKEIPFDVMNFHWYSSSHIPYDNSAWNKAAYGIPVDIDALPNNYDPYRKRLNTWNFRDKHISNKELWVTEFGYGECGGVDKKCKYQTFNMPGKMIGSWQVPDRHRSDVKGAWIVRTAVYFMGLGINLGNYYSTETEGDWYSTGQWGMGGGNEFHVWDHMDPEDYPNPGDRYEAIKSSISSNFDRNGFNCFGLFGSLLNNGGYPITHAYWWTATFRNRLKDYVFVGWKKDTNNDKISIACFRHLTQDKSCYVVWYRDMNNNGVENYALKFPTGTTQATHVTTYIPIIPDPSSIPVENIYNPGTEWYPIIGPVGAVYDPDVQGSPLASQRKVWNAGLNKYELTSNLDRSWEQVNAIVDYIKNDTEAQKGTTGIATTRNLTAATLAVNVSEFPEYFFFDGNIDPTFESQVVDLSAIPVSDNQVRLYWNNTNTSDESYEIFMSMSLETGYTKHSEVTAGSENSTTISGLLSGTTYYFKVRAKKGEQLGTFSEYSSAKTFDSVVDPSNLRYGNRTTSTIDLAWDWNQDDLENINFEFYSYYIYRSNESGNYQKIAEVNDKTIKHYTDTGLISGTYYNYRVRVMGTNGNSDYSNILNVRTLLPSESAPLLTYIETDKLGSKLILTYDLPMSNPSYSDRLLYSLTEDGNERLINGIALDADNPNRIFLYVPDDTLADYDKRLILRLSYTKPSTGGIQSTYGFQTNSVTNKFVVNNVGNFTNLYATYRINPSGPDFADVTQNPEMWNTIKLTPDKSITTSPLTDTYERQSDITLSTVNITNSSGTSYRWGGSVYNQGTYEGDLTSDVAVTKTSWATIYQAQSNETFMSRLILKHLNPANKYTFKLFASNGYGNSTSYSIKINGINSNVVSTFSNKDTFATIENATCASNGDLIIDIKNHIDPPNYAYVYIQMMILEEYLPGDVVDNTVWIREIACNEADELNRVGDRDITITSNVIGTPTHYMISELSDFSDATWVTYASSIPYQLSEGYGDKEVYFKVKNAFYESNTRVLRVTYYDDYVPLVVNRMYINDDTDKTYYSNVNIKFSYNGKPTHYKLSEDENALDSLPWISWISNNITYTFDNTSESGNKTIYGMLKDAIDISEMVSDSILYEKIDYNNRTISITFENDITGTPTVKFAPLKYNKRFAISNGVDDSGISAWNRGFQYFNGGWIDDQNYWHHNLARTTGAYAPRVLSYTDGFGTIRRFSVTSANWYNLRTQYWSYPMENATPGSSYPYITWPEQIEINDFDGCCTFHDVQDPALDTQGGSIQNIVNGITDANTNHVLPFIGRRLMIMCEPNGDAKYTSASEQISDIKLISRQVNDSLGFKYINLNGTNNYSKLKLGRYFNDTGTLETYKTAFLTNIINPSTGNVYMWCQFGMHGYSNMVDTITSSNIGNMPKIQFFNWLHDTYGSGGNDTMWFASDDEIIQYKYLCEHSTISSSYSGKTLTITMDNPIFENFYWDEYTILVDGISGNNITSYDSSAIKTGCGYKGSLIMVNVNYDETLLNRADKYTTLLENTENLEYKPKAEYFVQRLRSNLGTQFTNRITVATTPPTVTSYIINDSNSIANSVRIVNEVEYTGKATHYSIKNNIGDPDTWLPISANGTGGNPTGSTQDLAFLPNWGWNGGIKSVKFTVKRIGTSGDQIYNIYSTNPNVNPSAVLLGTVGISDGSDQAYSTITLTTALNYIFIKESTTSRVKLIRTVEPETFIDFTNTDDSIHYPRLVFYHLMSNSAGTKTVYLKLKNNFGEMTQISRTVTYVPPALNIISFSLNNGDATTYNPSVSLNLTYEGIATHYMVSESSTFVGASWNTISDPLPNYTLSSSYGTKQVYIKLKNDDVESTVFNDTIQYLELVTKAAVSLMVNNSGDLNKIYYESSDFGLVNKLVPSNHTSYTAKQLHSTIGDTLPWYFEMNTTYYPVTAFYPGAGTQTRYLSLSAPIFTMESGPYANIHMQNVYAGSGTTANKSRFVLTLPVGDYRMKVLYTTNGDTINETNRVGTWIKVTANDVDYGLDHLFDAGTITKNNPQWVRTIEFSVTSAGTGNVILGFWSTISGGHVGINMFELTKLD